MSNFDRWALAGCITLITVFVIAYYQSARLTPAELNAKDRDQQR